MADINKYGGFNKAAGAYFFLVEHEQKGKLVRTIEFVPLYLVNDLNSGKLTLEEYCKTSLSLINPKIILSKIKFDTLFEVNGFRMHLSGRTGDSLVLKNGNQLILDFEYIAYIKNVIKVVSRANKDDDITEYDHIGGTQNLALYDFLTSKIQNTVYKEKLLSQYENLKKARELFTSSSLLEQCTFIMQLLHTFACDSTTTNFTLLGKGVTGRIVIPKKINTIDEIYIVSQSITGLFEKKINLIK